MVRMGCRPGGDHVQHVAGDDQVGIGSADTADAVGRDNPAGPHGTPGAGSPGFAVFTGGLLHLVAVPDRLDALLHHQFKDRFCVLVDRPLIFLLLDECRVHKRHPRPVELADIEPFPDQHGFWFFLCHISLTPSTFDSW